ncbi:Small nuclear ribonucleoprotein E [Nymphaea thermarum]|nr:Small nuclear ribonucleoprotein E [Nymphaea thermarum]
MTQPIVQSYLQVSTERKSSLSKARIQIWLFEQKDLRIEGRIIGFDEYMNLVLDDAEEVNVKKKTRKSLGRILLKGDSITLMMNTRKGGGRDRGWWQNQKSVRDIHGGRWTYPFLLEGVQGSTGTSGIDSGIDSGNRWGFIFGSFSGYFLHYILL